MKGELKKNMDNFDWVTARSSCSLPLVFEKLKLDVEADVKTRNAMRSKALGFGFDYGFSVTSNPGNFKVVLNSGQHLEAVKFSLGDKSISVTDSQGELMFEATLTLNDEGECRIKINGQERELWDMRRMALEHLFFGIY